MNRGYATALYSILHFFVDFACIFFIFGSLRDSGHWLLCLLNYNLFAFAMQLPLGVLGDLLEKNRLLAGLGCLILAISPLFSDVFLLPFALAGLGNGLFHIGAGREVLQLSGKRLAALGVFVSPGALGLYLGGMMGKAGNLPLALVMGVLGIFGLASIFVPSAIKPKQTTERGGPRPLRLLVMALTPLFLVIVLRSYVGLTLSFPWKGEGQAAFLLVLALAGGKAAGGFLADRFGAVKTSLVTLCLSALLLLFFRLSPLGILSVFLFNMTMPLTLGGIASYLPGQPGLAFGLTTFGLFLGFVPVLTSMPNPLSMPYGYVAVSLLSVILLYFGLRGARHAD